MEIARTDSHKKKGGKVWIALKAKPTEGQGTRFMSPAEGMIFGKGQKSESSVKSAIPRQ